LLTQSELPVEKLVFLDETAVRCLMPVLYGWSRCGEQAVMSGTRRGRRLSVIGALALDGCRGMMAYEGTLNTSLMVQYIDTTLGPNLRPGDVLVLDGLSVHKTQAVREAAKRHGASLLVLPPYSPELNPVEHAWSTLKARLRKLGVHCFHQLEDLVHATWKDIQTFSAGWVRACGYVAST
jgi:transposase